MSSRVLTVGTDSALLKLRAELLNSHYETDTAVPAETLNRLRKDHFDLLLVCCSTPFDRASSIICEAHAEFPCLCIVRLLASDSPPVQKPIADAIIKDCQDPRPWINAVDYLLHSHEETSNYY